MAHTLGEIAKITGAKLDGDPERIVNRVSSLQSAKPDEISFLANKRHVKYLENSAAGAIILSPGNKHRCSVETLVCDDPYLAFAITLRHMQPDFSFIAGVHPAASISQHASISNSSYIAAGSVVEAGAEIGEDVYIGPACVLGQNVRIGAGSRLVARVTLCEGVQIGAHVLLHPGVVIGADGFGIVKDKGEWLKIPQIGSVIIADHVEIGANTTVDRGALTDTIIEEGVKLDNQIQVGHGVIIGAHTAIAGCVGIAGSAVIGKRCMIGGHSAISGHIELADDVIITGMSGVSKTIKEAGIYSSAIPVVKNAIWRKNLARFRNLELITRRLIRLEKKFADDEAIE